MAEDMLKKTVEVTREFKQPNMREIYDSIDYLVEGIHQNDFIRAKIRRDSAYRNVEFRPTFSHQNVSSTDMMWSQLKDTFETINNVEYMRDDFANLDSIEQLNDIAIEV